MTRQLQSLDIRVQRSLGRNGYDEVSVTELGKGHVRIAGSIDSERDRAIALALTKSVAGVTQISSELRVSAPQRS